MAREKYNKLVSNLTDLEGIAVAVSGGLDSMFLAITAKKVLRERVIAITVSTPYMHAIELDDVQRTMAEYDIPLEIVTVEIPEIIRNNPENRCYLCKTALFREILTRAHSKGFDRLADGTNAGDLSEHRPGLRALEELKVLSPLKDAGLDKSDIRTLAKEFGYDFHEKDSNSCLLTRLPYDHEIREAEIRQIETAESFLISEGFRQVRFRARGDTAIVEVHPDQVKMLEEQLRSVEYSRFFQNLGFTEVVADKIGYKAGRNK
jgi:uncharacterized protein